MPKLCEFENCRKQASYGEYYGKLLRCNIHKGEYKFVSKLCQQGNCKTRASFNFEGETKAVYCSEHKKENMVNVKSKTCIFENCKTRPSYNYANETTPIYCCLHKKKNMELLNVIYCNFENCKTQPTFNFEGELNGKFCDSHKEEGMINVKTKTCEYPECKIIPIFSFEGEKTARFCNNHKKEKMIDIRHKNCEYLGCKIRPNFNFEGENKGKFCNIHKEEKMIDIKHKKCKANFCLGTRANIKYKGYCAPCYQNLFPTDPLTYQIRSKTKEIAVRDYINTIFEGFQHDKPIFTGNCDCTNRRRIDHRVLIGNTLLCIETDENQHKDYNKKDEEIRYNDLYMIHSGKFVFIRFNPDKYINKNNKSVNPMLYTRLPILKEEIEKQMDRIKNEENTELLEIIKLYYDGDN
jgi:hypothetical protein